MFAATTFAELATRTATLDFVDGTIVRRLNLGEVAEIDSCSNNRLRGSGNKASCADEQGNKLHFEVCEFVDDGGLR